MQVSKTSCQRAEIIQQATVQQHPSIARWWCSFYPVLGMSYERKHGQCVHAPAFRWILLGAEWQHCLCESGLARPAPEQVSHPGPRCRSTFLNIGQRLGRSGCQIILPDMRSVCVRFLKLGHQLAVGQLAVGRRACAPTGCSPELVIRAVASWQVFSRQSARSLCVGARCVRAPRRDEQPSTLGW